MQVNLDWEEGMGFAARSGEQIVALDAKRPLGKEAGFTPKELVAIGLGGCTAMDVVALLKKFRQQVESFQIHVETIPTEGGHPVTFKESRITFNLKGAVDRDKFKEAVRLSQTQYCGVSAMLAKSHPITYQLVLNGENIGEGQAEFA